jgi:hypothetical protein
MGVLEFGELHENLKGSDHRPHTLDSGECASVASMACSIHADSGSFLFPNRKSSGGCGFSIVMSWFIDCLRPSETCLIYLLLPLFSGHKDCTSTISQIEGQLLFQFLFPDAV